MKAQLTDDDAVVVVMGGCCCSEEKNRNFLKEKASLESKIVFSSKMLSSVLIDKSISTQNANEQSHQRN